MSNDRDPSIKELIYEDQKFRLLNWGGGKMRIECLKGNKWVTTYDESNSFEKLFSIWNKMENENDSKTIEIVDHLFEHDINQENMFYTGQQYAGQEVHPCIFDYPLNMVVYYKNARSLCNTNIVLDAFCKAQPNWAESHEDDLQEWRDNNRE